MLAVELMFRNDWQVARKLVWGESIPSAVRRNLRAPREVNREEDWKCIFWGLAARSDLRGTITLYAPDPRVVGRLSYRCGTQAHIGQDDGDVKITIRQIFRGQWQTMKAPSSEDGKWRA